MSAQTASGTIRDTTFLAAPTPAQDIPTEFMDVGARYWFRAYLTANPPDDKGPDFVTEGLRSLLVQKSLLSNSEVYDELHSALCGPEPLEREPLLQFQLFCANAMQSELKRTLQTDSAQSEIAMTATKSPTMIATDSTPTVKTDPTPTARSWLNFIDVVERPAVLQLRLVNLNRLLMADPNAAEVFQLTDLIGNTLEETALVLNLQVDDVKRRLTRALSIMRETATSSDESLQP